MISKITPDWILVILLVILLAFTTYTTLEKGFSQYKDETKSFMTKVQEESRRKEEMKPLLTASGNAHEESEGEEEKEKKHKKGKQKKHPHHPQQKPDEPVSVAVPVKSLEVVDAGRLQEKGEEEKSNEEVVITITTQEEKERKERQEVLYSLLQEETNTPWDKAQSIMVLVLVVTVLNLLKGGGKFPSPVGIECGSFW
jgi:phosphate/sulfate permease